MQEADAEISVVGVTLRGGAGGLEAEERLAEGRAAMLGSMSQRGTIGKESIMSQEIPWYQLYASCGTDKVPRNSLSEYLCQTLQLTTT